MTTRLLLVDSMGLLYRGHFAMSGRPLSAPDGTVTSGLFHLLREILDQRDARDPDITVAAMDSPGPTFRNALYPPYKANRPPMPDELRTQADLARRLIPAMGIPMVQREGLEADDVIASLAARAVAEGGSALILTADKDLLQLVGEGVTVLRPGRPGKPAVEVGPEGVPEILGVPPGLVADLFALTGDSSDNVPGAKGIGPKTAVALLERFGSLDAVLARCGEVEPPSVRRKLEESRETVLLSRRLVDLSGAAALDVSLDELATAAPDLPAASELLGRLGMASLTKRLLRRSAAVGSGFPEGLFAGDRSGASGHPRIVVLAAGSTPDPDSTVNRFPAGVPAAVAAAVDPLAPLQGTPLGVAVAFAREEAVYLPLAGPAALQADSARRLLGRLLSDRPLWAADGKRDLHAVNGLGVPIGGIAGDPTLADYLLHPEGGSHALAGLTATWLGRSHPIGEGGPSGSGGGPPEADGGSAAERCASDACVAWELCGLLRRELGRDAELLRIYDDLELPLIPVLSAMERRGVAVDMAALADLEEGFTSRMDELERTASGMIGVPVNLNSPVQVSSILFERLGLEPVRKTPGGSLSSGADVLESLEGAHPFVPLVLEHREISKLLSTYVRKLPGSVSPEDGRVHTSFSQTVTATGRLSSSNPNLQNIPVRTQRGRDVRRCFRPGSPDEVFVTADYSQIELRVLAHLAGPGALREAFMAGLDIHDATARALFGDSSKDHRRKAKEVNFSILYGISPWGLSRRLGIPVAEAGAVIDRYLASYPELEFFFRKCIADAEATGETRTMLGRRRLFRDFAASRGNTRKAMERMVVNTIVQGSAADIIKLAMLRVHARLGRDFHGAGLVLQVHDELVASVRREDARRAEEAVSAEMSGAMELTVPLVVDTGSGENWMEAQH